jgi:copper chaperone CopZ
VCAHAVRVSLKSVSGVDSVDVSLEKGLAVVTMKPGNTATLKQLNEAIAKNGFTMKDSTATVVGTVVTADGKATIRVSGSNDLLQLVPQSGAPPTAASMGGKTVVVEGTIPEGVKGKTPDSIRYQSMMEDKSQ